ncbi:MAG: SgcJ/EcaC family oxidoreductase [Candidatus Acidiferrales bacterium]
MKKSNYSTLSAIAVLTLAFVSTASTNSDKCKSLSAADTAAIRSVLQHYREGWLAGDADAVRRTFTQDAVLLPHHGVPPVVGMAAINEFWFPTSSTKTTITKFLQTIDELAGDESLAYVRGRSEVEWTLEDGGKAQSWRNAGNFLAVLKKQADGKWLVSHLIWDDAPNQQVN